MKSKVSKVIYSNQTIEKAKKLVELERKAIKAKKSSLVEVKQQAIREMTNFINATSMDEMFAIDAYINENNLLKDINEDLTK